MRSMDAAALIRWARHEAGLTQQELARRLRMSQPALAKLERAGANPTVATLDRTLRATGRRLTLDAPPWQPSIDESLVRKQLELTPEQRLRGLETMYVEARALALAGDRLRG